MWRFHVDGGKTVNQTHALASGRNIRQDARKNVRVISKQGFQIKFRVLARKRFLSMRPNDDEISDEREEGVWMIKSLTVRHENTQ